MKRLITALILVAMSAGAAMAENNIYEETVANFNYMMDRGTNLTQLVVKNCTTEQAAGDRGDLKTQAYISSFYTNASEVINNRDVPGSQIRCGGEQTSGYLLTPFSKEGTAEYHIAGGKLFKAVIRANKGQVMEYFPKGLVRISNPDGDFVTYTVDPVNPVNTKFLTARLQISLSSSAAFLESKGIQLGDNELARIMNRVIKTGAMTAKNFGTFALRLLFEQDGRDDFTKAVVMVSSKK